MRVSGNKIWKMVLEFWHTQPVIFTLGTFFKERSMDKAGAYFLMVILMLASGSTGKVLARVATNIKMAVDTKVKFGTASLMALAKWSDLRLSTSESLRKGSTMGLVNYTNRTESTKVSLSKTRNTEQVASSTQRLMFNMRVSGKTTRKMDKENW